MPNIRRGFPPGVAVAEIFLNAANAGVIASSIGKESRMPAPRRNLRREMAGCVETNGAFIRVISNQWTSFVQKQLTLHNFMHQRPHSIMTRTGALQSLCD